jgi:hypothetical protein
MTALPEIRIVVTEPHKPSVVKMVSNTLEALQREVGGNLELHHFANLTLPCMMHCWINEDGKRLGLKPNLVADSGEVILGNVVTSKSAALSSKEIGLTERDARFACLFLDHLRGIKSEPPPNRLDEPCFRPSRPEEKS